MAEINADGMNRCYGLREFIKKKDTNLWYFGPHIECERLDNRSRPADALVTWDDGQYMFVLRKRKDTSLINDSLPKADDSLPKADDSLLEADDSLPEADLAYPKRSWKSTYIIGDAAFCKVQEIQNANRHREHELILRVKELEPQIPLPETIYTWEDEGLLWHITRRVPGETLQNAWLGLTDAQRENIADQVAQCAHALAKHTSTRIEGGLGGPSISMRFLFLPSGVTNAAEAKAHLSPIPDSESPFVLSHGELSPNNIIVKNGHLAGIIDWESLQYEPRFWLATRLVGTIANSFDPEIYKGIYENNAWGILLSKKLVSLGYPLQHKAFVAWTRKRLGKSADEDFVKV
jgi:hypothetical protein